MFKHIEAAADKIKKNSIVDDRFKVVENVETLVFYETMPTILSAGVY